MNKNKFYKDRKLPFAECRYSKENANEFKPHMHSTFCIGAIEEGRVEYRVGNELRTLVPGNLALINPEVLHSCNPAEKTGRSFYMLYLDVQWCLVVQKSMWLTARFVPAERIMLRNKELFGEFCRTMAKLMGEQIHALAKEQMLVELVEKVLHLCCNPTAPAASLSGNIKTLKEMLSHELASDLTLNSLAGMLDTNPYTLLRRFKQETGITPHAFRMNCRINAAKAMLQKGADIADTALLCGFFDQSHFHHQFKAMTMVTPRQYQVNFLQ